MYTIYFFYGAIMSQRVINPRKLMVLDAVVRHKNITAAAKELCMTQPAVTNVIKQLEVYFNQKIVNHVGKKIIITDAGTRLANYWHEF